LRNIFCSQTPPLHPVSSALSLASPHPTALTPALVAPASSSTTAGLSNLGF
jgi:hypothetical protein